MLTKGQKINDRYEIIKTIGEGGMANVYLAEDTILERKVAIKVLRGDLSNDEKFTIATDTIAQISYDYLISTNVMALSRKRIIDMFADMLDDYIEKQSDNIHARIKANAAKAKHL